MLQSRFHEPLERWLPEMAPLCQVFEIDKKLLQSHAMPYVAAYTWETGTIIRALDMEEFLPPRKGAVPEEELRLRMAKMPRRQQRKLRQARPFCWKLSSSVEVG